MNSFKYEKNIYYNFFQEKIVDTTKYIYRIGTLSIVLYNFSHLVAGDETIETKQTLHFQQKLFTKPRYSCFYICQPIC